MLVYFLSTLDIKVRFLSVVVIDPERKEHLDEVRRRLDAFPFVEAGASDARVHAAWNDAYGLERLLALAEPDDRLPFELTRRTKEAVEEGSPAGARLMESLEHARKTLFDAAEPGKNSIIRSLVLEALEAKHWTIQRKFNARVLQAEARSRMIKIGACAFSLFLAPYLYLFFFAAPPAVGKVAAEWSPFSWFPLYSALTAGAFGVAFSRLLFLQSHGKTSSLGVLQDARNWSSNLSRALVGTCGALIVFFVLRSGLLGGSMFPKFPELGLDLVRWPDAGREGFRWLLILPNEQLALLVVWSFLAGFSERLAPGVLASTEKKLSDAVDKAK